MTIKRKLFIYYTTFISRMTINTLIYVIRVIKYIKYKEKDDKSYDRISSHVLTSK